MPREAPEPQRPRPENDALLGVVLNGKFRIDRIVASGGMGRIYQGEQIPLGRSVAVKVLHSKYTSSQEDPAFQKRFFLEASILSKLQHPNIVTVFDYGRIEGLDDESYFMAMEFLAGETLHRRLKAMGAMSPVEAIGFARQIARGLREAHRQGVVHRDLKPSNIMLVPEEDGAEIVKILDFGLVKVLADDSEELTKEGSFLGSPRYMSPEQIAHGKVDHRTDIYSLGVIFYQCLCGRTPFENENSVHTLMAHLQLPIPPMRERNPSVDVAPVLEAFTLRCLEKDPASRPATMDELLRGLRECEQALGLAAGSTTGSQGSGSFSSASAPPPLPVSGSHNAAELTGAGARASHIIGVGSTLSVTPQPAAIEAPTARSNRGMLLALVAVAVLAAALAALAAIGRASTSSPPPPATAPLTPTAPSTYRLVIESSVEGAQVYEGGALLGATPLTVVVDNVAVRREPRRFVVMRDGYGPFEVSAAASEEASMRVVASLVARAPIVAEPAPPVAETPRPNVRPVVRPAVRPLRPPTTPNPPTVHDDIRSHR
jgi:serine/threonine-protein kinase